MVTRIADGIGINGKLDELASLVYKDAMDPSRLAFVGIQRRGVELAQRIVHKIAENTGVTIPLGVLDITFYRDDLSMVSHHPVVHSTQIPFNLDDKMIVLVDDVVYTGRTIRAALDALVDFGRPRIVRLLALVDRGHRELPIQPDYVGWEVPTKLGDVIHVKVRELDGEDAVDMSTASNGRKAEG